MTAAADPSHGPLPKRGAGDSATAIGSPSNDWATGSGPIPMPTSGLGSQPIHEVESAPSASTPAPSAPARPGASVRASFEAGELAMVCSRFDVGIIESIKEFRRGSGRAPKVVLKTNHGRYLLKRRTAGKDTPGRVAFSHAIQLHLAHRRFPLPQLIATRTDGGTMLALGQHIYELFEFVPGNNYDGSLDATADAGRALGFFHRLLGSFHADGSSPAAGSYHNAPGLAEHMATITARLEGPSGPALIGRLCASYADAAKRVESLGFASWPAQIIHGDWHPGNMLFRGSRVAAVIDYDTARSAPRVIDLANGALQFSITMKGHDPERWPEGLDESRLKRFCRGYETVKDCVISTAELDALPWLMIEALIVEAAVPIAATGSFAGLSGASFLRMVDAKCGWLQQHAARITSLLSE
jgi:Ser/Thr protein kinase RdoA (MazF antagonist)